MSAKFKIGKKPKTIPVNIKLEDLEIGEAQRCRFQSEVRVLKTEGMKRNWLLGSREDKEEGGFIVWRKAPKEKKAEKVHKAEVGRTYDLKWGLGGRFTVTELEGDGSSRVWGTFVNSPHLGRCPLSTDRLHLNRVRRTSAKLGI